MSEREPEMFVACPECHRKQGDPIHNTTLTDTGESQHPFIAGGPILIVESQRD